MKGVVFNTFEKFVVTQFGDDFFEDVLDSCTLQTNGAFVGPGTYPDTDLMEIVDKTVTKANLPLDAAMKSFGTFMFHELAKAYPVFVEQKDNLKDFLLSVNDVIHVEVNKLYQHAHTPHFSYKEPDSKTLEITYTSSRDLPDLFEGLVLGAAEHYKEMVTLSRSPVGQTKGVWKFSINF